MLNVLVRPEAAVADLGKRTFKNIQGQGRCTAGLALSRFNSIPPIIQAPLLWMNMLLLLGDCGS